MGTMARVAAYAVAVGMLCACDTNKVVATVRVELQSPSPQQTAQAAAVLQGRFLEHVGSYFSKVTATPAGDGVDVVFTGNAPPDDVIQRFASTQGVFRIYPADKLGNVLVSDLDVEEAQASEGTQGSEIMLTVSERAGERLQAYTSRNPGKLLVTTWDRKEVMRAIIQGAFGRRFQTTGIDRDTARFRAAILRHGRLPVGVRSVEIHHPAS